MFINVKSDNTIELTAIGLKERNLLRKLADGIHVQAFDDSKVHAAWLTITPVLLPDNKEDS